MKKLSLSLAIFEIFWFMSLSMARSPNASALYFIYCNERPFLLVERQTTFKLARSRGRIETLVGSPDNLRIAGPAKTKGKDRFVGTRYYRQVTPTEFV